MVYQFGIMSVDNSLNNELFNKLKDAILPPINDISNNSMAEKQKIYNDHIQYDIDKILSCDNEQIKNYCKLNYNQKLMLELKNIGLDISYNATPNNFITHLKSFIGKNQDGIAKNLSQFIIQESVKFGIPYSCKDSKLNRNGFQKSYIKFVCKFHTHKRTCCKSKFKIIIDNKIITDIDFIEIYHNHSLDRNYIESKVPLITDDDKIKIREAVQKGLSTSSLRKLTNTNLLPQQMYNVIRNDKKEYLSNEIMHLQNYVKEIQNKFDVFWKFDEDNKFYNLIIINSIIKLCPYANDIVVDDDTMRTNNFDYPFLVFLVLMLNNDNKTIQEKAHKIIDECKCIKDDFPCIHTLYNRIKTIPEGEPLIKRNEIPNKYFRNSLTQKTNTKYLIQNINKSKKKEWSYNNLMDRLIPYVSYAQRSEQLKYCFRNFFNEADKIKIEIDPNAKNVFQTSGAHITVPSKMVDLPKKIKRNHCCRICGKVGHYACTCKFKK